ncbi:Protein_phosphatase PP2A regulatory subunit A [Hexamita inflata]|uniref:Protein phosphatase PP2A regulatory subunit A n=1 Tax=Hexamita inflata TaxID=28002 RepID=A0AA86QVD8_9EUKA|nr:Protein phosphatase PP2A regulatory subunit A [Hexamita inflata]
MDIITKYINDIKDCIELDTRVNLAQNLIIVGLAAGLQPSQYLLENLQQAYSSQPEEVIVSFSQRLGDLLRITAYDAAQIPEKCLEHFFKHVDLLSQFNSHHVNKGIGESFRIALKFNNNHQAFTQFIQRMLQSQFTLQRALCGQLIPILYESIPSSDQTLKPLLGTSFGALISDTDSFVRSQAALSLTKFIEQIIASKTSDKFVYSPSYIFVCYDRLVQDLSDVVRANNAPNGVLVLKFLLQLQKQLENDARETKEIKEVLPALIKNISRGSSDRYWRVRMLTAQQMPIFFDLISRKLDVQDCAVMFRLLAEDCEQDIRVSAMESSHLVLKFLDPPTILNVFCPTLTGRANEKESIKVKVALAKNLGAVLKAGQNLDNECKEILNQSVQECFRKMYADKSAEVRQEVITGLGNVFGEEKFIQEMFQMVVTNKNEKWIVRTVVGPRNAFLNQEEE